MEKKTRLKDGSQVTIRELRLDDLDRSFAFFSALPKEDRAYLRVDVTKRDIVARRIKLIESGSVFRLVALIDDEIVADGALELGIQEWNRHIAEIRLIVAHPYQRLGLGMLMARELFILASGKKIEEIMVEFMGPQVGARKIFERLGFHEDAVLRNYVRDIDGNKQDLILMRCDLESIWQKLDDFIAGFDWQRTR
jgi:ribosomal protein S18 acetylase RimI-like enzyme